MIVVMRIGLYVYPGTPLTQDGRVIGRVSQKCEPDPEHPGYFLAEVALGPEITAQWIDPKFCTTITMAGDEV